MKLYIIHILNILIVLHILIKICYLPKLYNMMRNVRRSAVKKEYLRTKKACANDGMRQRMILCASLGRSDRDLFDILDKRNIDCVKEYPVIGCELRNPDNTVAVETATVPIFRITNGRSINNLGNEFCLPITGPDAFLDTYSNFTHWLLSRNVHAEICGRTLVPSSSVNTVSDIQMFELYSQALVTSLGDFFASGKERDAENVWLMCREIYIRLQNTKSTLTIDQLLEKQQKFVLLTRDRDSSLSCAREYNQMISSMTPFDYYWCLYQTMVTNPEVVTKSHMMHLDTFLFGLMTQLENTVIGVSWDGISDSFLRMVFERAITKMPAISTSAIAEYVDIEPLTQKLHEHSGVNVERTLRYWTFIVESMRNVILGKTLTVNDFRKQLHIVRDNVNEQVGITQACLTICPDTARYLDDSRIAEFIITVLRRSMTSTSGQSTTVLITSLFTSHSDIPTLTDIVEKNRQELRDVRRRAEEASARISSDTSSSNDAAIKTMIDMLEEAHCSTEHLLHSGNSWRYKEKLAHLSREGSERSTEILKTLINLGATVAPPLLSVENATTLVRRASLEGTAVSEYFMSGLSDADKKKLRDRRNVPKARPYEFLRKMLQQGPSTDIERFGESCACSTFVTFEIARELARVRVETISCDIISMELECVICMDTCDVSGFVALHNDKRHMVCRDCYTTLMDRNANCPMCRHAL